MYWTRGLDIRKRKENTDTHSHISESLKTSFQHISCEWVKRRTSTWFWHRVGHGLRHLIIYELHTLAGKEANLYREQQWDRRVRWEEVQSDLDNKMKSGKQKTVSALSCTHHISHVILDAEAEGLVLDIYSYRRMTKKDHIQGLLCCNTSRQSYLYEPFYYYFTYDS